MDGLREGAGIEDGDGGILEYPGVLLLGLIMELARGLAMADEGVMMLRGLPLLDLNIFRCPSYPSLAVKFP